MWEFSRDFAEGQRIRFEKLTSWRSYDEIVDAIVRTSTVEPGSVKWKPRKQAPIDAHRLEFKVDANADAVDALFNSEHGYRAKFAGSMEAGEAANRQIVNALSAKHRGSVAGANEDHCQSLCSARAKVWIMQKKDQRLHPAITGKGPTPPTIDILHPQWIERLDEWVETSHGARILARGGVLAVTPGGSFEVKGRWIRHSQPWLDPAKDARSGQLHWYGFS